ncbi:MAG: hypothetical protein COB98_07495 [Flavobacteriaceae bacterium]|nr:MAG: hypothetical protein COB98_07495 [Flavobacteriaceae bacterium]
MDNLYTPFFFNLNLKEMIFKKITHGIVLLSFLFFLTNCTSSDTENTARIQLKLVDAPGDYMSVNIEIINLQYKSNAEDNEWQNFNPEINYPIQVDLISLTAGNKLLLTDHVLPAGNLHQIRLVLSNNNTLEIEGNVPDQSFTAHLNTPSAQQSGLKLILNQKLEAGLTYSFLLDWDVQQSIIKAGNSGKFNLNPVIKVISETNTGSLKGKLTANVLSDNSKQVPLYNATIALYNISEDLIAQTTSNEKGDYMLYGIPPGDYHLDISHKSYAEHASEGTINITKAKVYDYGLIELSKRTL